MDPAHRRRCIITAATIAPLALVLYVPAWLAYDQTFAFLTRTDGYNSFRQQPRAARLQELRGLGRSHDRGRGNRPALLRALRTWNRDPLVRFAVIAAVGTGGLFFFMPWKAVHLLPTLMALLFWIAASERNLRRQLWLLIGALALDGIVVLRPLAPDTPNAGRSAHMEPTVTWGLLVNDIRCRLEYMDVPPSMYSGAFDCSMEPVRGPGDTEPSP